MVDNVPITAGSGTSIAADDIGSVFYQRVKIGVGADGTAADWEGFVRNYIAAPTGNFTRPADTTAYASGDLVANSTTAGSVTPVTLAAARISGGTGSIRKVEIRKSGTSITNAIFRVHLYLTSPTVTNGDNGAWLSNNVANYLGAFDVVMDRAFSDGAAGTGVPLAGGEINFVASGSANVFALVEARAAYTPASAEVFTLRLEVLQN